jgi:hypothetical protein
MAGELKKFEGINFGDVFVNNEELFITLFT